MGNDGHEARVHLKKCRSPSREVARTRPDLRGWKPTSVKGHLLLDLTPAERLAHLLNFWTYAPPGLRVSKT